MSCTILGFFWFPCGALGRAQRVTGPQEMSELSFGSGGKTQSKPQWTPLIRSILWGSWGSVQITDWHLPTPHMTFFTPGTSGSRSGYRGTLMSLNSLLLHMTQSRLKASWVFESNWAPCFKHLVFPWVIGLCS